MRPDAVICVWVLHLLLHQRCCADSRDVALSEGASLFHVSRMLGHSSIAITADTYGHWTDEGREDVATRLERAILGSQNGLATTLATTAPVGALPAADFELENDR